MANYADQADNIRRIAKQGKLKGALGPAADRDPIEGKVTPFLTGTFSPTNDGTGSGAGNDTSTNSNGSEEQDGTKTMDPSNPMTFRRGGGSATSGETEESTGVQDMESVMDDETSSTNAKDETNEGASTSNGSLTGLTGMTDCSTGQCINIHLNGQFPPPDGWDDPDTPPVEPYPQSTYSPTPNSWELGYYWITTQTFPEIPTMPLGYLFSQMDVMSWMEQLTFTHPVEGPLVFYRYTQVLNNTVRCTFKKPGGVIDIYSVTAGRVWCDDEYSEGACVIEQPAPNGEVATEWPTDGCYDLALIDGKFQANQYDSEAPSWAKEGSSAVNVCYGDGRTGTVYATAQGGSMLVETIEGEPSTAKVYSSDGTFQAGGDATSQFMNQYLPK